jgi:uroporphyrinogen decarboxylase
LDHAVSIAPACRTVGPDIALWGNLDPIRVLAQGTPESVRQKAVETLQAVKAAGHRRFVLSSGCTLALETPPENLDALIRSSQDAQP